MWNNILVLTVNSGVELPLHDLLLTHESLAVIGYISTVACSRDHANQ